jgi:hypothetical protein
MAMARDLIWWLSIVRDAIGFAFAAATGIVVWFRRRSARHWPIAFGNVESVSSYQDNYLWRTDIAYSFRLGDEFYSGEFQLRSFSERKASEKELRWKQQVGVRYSPANPQISVVTKDDQSALHGGEYARPGFPS